MVSGVLPFFGICWYFYKKNQQKTWLIFPILLSIVFLWDTTVSGLMVVGFLSYIVILSYIYSKYNKKTTIVTAFAIPTSFAIIFAIFVFTTPTGHKIQETVETINLIATQYKDLSLGNDVAPLDISNRPEPMHKFFTRLTTSWVDLIIAFENPLGVGMNLKSQHWKLLETSNLCNYEIDTWIKRGYISPLMVYTNYLTELGIIGLFLFCYIVYQMLYKIYAYYNDSKDNFVIAMFFVLLTYLVIFFTQRVDNAFSFIYCLGFTYAYTQTNNKANTLTT